MRYLKFLFLIFTSCVFNNNNDIKQDNTSFRIIEKSEFYYSADRSLTPWSSTKYLYDTQNRIININKHLYHDEYDSTNIHMDYDSSLLPQNAIFSYFRNGTQNLSTKLEFVYKNDNIKEIKEFMINDTLWQLYATSLFQTSQNKIITMNRSKSEIPTQDSILITFVYNEKGELKSEIIKEGIRTYENRLTFSGNKLTEIESYIKDGNGPYRLISKDSIVYLNEFEINIFGFSADPILKLDTKTIIKLDMKKGNYNEIQKVFNVYKLDGLFDNQYMN